MIPLNCVHLEWLGDIQPTIFADTSCVLNEFDLQSLINYCSALKGCFRDTSACWGAAGFAVGEGIFHPHHCNLQTLYSCKSNGFALVRCLHGIASPMVRKDFHRCELNSSGSTPSIAWVYSLVLLSLGSYSSHKIASATVL